MGRFIGPEAVEVHYVATLTNYQAPTSTQLNAGVDLTGYIIDGGADFPQSGRTVPAADLASKWDSVIAGTRGGDMCTLTMHRDKVKADDTGWATLPPGTVGYFAVAPRGLATPGTFAVGDEVDIYPMEVITRNPSNLAARGATQQFTVQAAITDPPAMDFDLVA